MSHACTCTAVLCQLKGVTSGGTATRLSMCCAVMSPADHNIAEEATLVRSGAMSTSRLYARHQPTMELTTRSDAKDGASASRASRDGRRGCKGGSIRDRGA